jgi:hypothetical protein
LLHFDESIFLRRRFEESLQAASFASLRQLGADARIARIATE